MSETAEAEQGVKEGVADPEASEAQPKESDKDYNFRQLREKAERLEEENRRRDRQLEEMRTQMSQMTQSTATEKPNPWDGLDPFADDFGQRLREGIQQAMTEGMSEVEKRRQSDPEYRLSQARNRHSDFDTVVNDSTVEKLKYERPYLWESIQNSSDPLEAAYEALRSAVPASARQDEVARQEREKLAENKEKPKDLSGLPNQGTRLGANTGFRRPPKEERNRIWSEHRKRMRERGM